MEDAVQKSRRPVVVFDNVIRYANYVAAGVLVFIVLSVGGQVFLRYFFGAPIAWVTESNEMCLLFIAFLSTAWLLRQEGHVSLDIIITRFSPRRQNMINAVTSAICVIVLIVLVWYGGVETLEHYQRKLYRPTMLGFPEAAYLWVIPLGFFMLAVQFLRRSLRSWRSWRTL